MGVYISPSLIQHDIHHLSQTLEKNGGTSGDGVGGVATMTTTMMAVIICFSIGFKDFQSKFTVNPLNYLQSCQIFLLNKTK